MNVPLSPKNKRLTKAVKRIITALIAALTAFSVLPLAACGGDEGYVLNEQTFFLVMTNMQYYPEQYVKKNVELDCFTYELIDVDGKRYICGVRKCSSGFGCTCGKDTIIGFLLDYDGTIPEPRNQSEDSVEKTWVHLKGKLDSAEKTDIRIYAYNGDEIDYDTVETITFLTMKVDELSLIEDYSSLKYYVTK